MAYTAVDDSEAFFQCKGYVGNGSANNAITFDGTTDMQPDFVWIKNRDATDSHCLFDSVRGATKVLHSDTSAAEATDTDTLDSFTSDGFQVDADVKVNTNTEDYMSWNWKESATAGFDIVGYTGSGSARTISHSLSAVPHLMIVKNRTSGEHWRVYHHKNTAAPETDYLVLNTTAATDDATDWNDTAPTSSVFSVGTGFNVNKDTDSFIAYLFSEKQGFSKFGAYVGNGNVNGPFIYCGFKPAYIIIKEPDATSAWIVFSNKTPFDPSSFEKPRLVANATGTDSGSNLGLDFVANGFKLRETDTDINGSGDDFIYIAFAEAPLVNSNGVPCNAE
jgi:hypothetical protein